ncbi:MAG: hypothetical protein IKK57_13295 [Clostridia bacterium]|nr:hypothetical protein [Clostridia bacterium]
MPDPRWYEPWITPGEKILWQGEPAPDAPRFTKEDAKSLLFLPFLGAGVFMLYNIARSDPPEWVLWSFGGIIGIWLLGVLFSTLAPLLYRLWLTPGMAYAVTDRRILRYRRGTVDALDVIHLPRGRVIPTKDGCGTITFAMDKTTAVHVSPGGFQLYTHLPQDWLTALLRTSLASLDSFELYHIPEAEHVLALIRGVEPSIPDMQPLSDAPLLPLDPGEKLLWQGRPERPPLGFDYDWLNILPALFVLGVGLIAVGALTFLPRQTTDSPLIIQIIFSFPIFVGLYMLLGRTVLQRISMRRTVIVITDRRILRSIGGKVETFIPGETQRMGLFQGRDGSGTILLGDLWATIQAYRPIGTKNARSLSSYPGFQLRFIPDAARAMDAINALRRNITG